MNAFRFEDLLQTAAGDGASASPQALNLPLNLNELYRAWSIERGHSIECEILLSLSRATIAQLMANHPDESSVARVDTSELIEQIDRHLRQSATNRA